MSNINLSAMFDFIVVYRWLNPIIQLGNRRALQIKDLYDVLPEDKSSELGIVLGRS